MDTVSPPVLNTELSTRRRLGPLLTVAWFAGLLAICYAPVLVRLVKQWSTDEDMGHGFFVPLVAGYIAWQKRHQLQGRTFQPNYWGILLTAWAGFQLVVATLGAELFLARTAFVLSVIGSVLTLGGTYALRVLWFPLFLLFFMVPLPAVVYNQLTLRLQIIASQFAEVTLNFVGIPVYREGNILELASQKLSVAEACSGIRSLLSLTFLGAIYGYFFESKAWMRFLLFLSTVPIAILANAGRVTLTGFLSEIDPEYAQGFMHTFSGWVVFVIALLMLLVVHKVANSIYHAVTALRTSEPGSSEA